MTAIVTCERCEAAPATERSKEVLRVTLARRMLATVGLPLCAECLAIVDGHAMRVERVELFGREVHVVDRVGARSRWMARRSDLCLFVDGYLAAKGATPDRFASQLEHARAGAVLVLSLHRPDGEAALAALERFALESAQKVHAPRRGKAETAGHEGSASWRDERKQA